jgi:hypothetical protein
MYMPMFFSLSNWPYLLSFSRTYFHSLYSSTKIYQKIVFHIILTQEPLQIVVIKQVKHFLIWYAKLLVGCLFLFIIILFIHKWLLLFKTYSLSSILFFFFVIFYLSCFCLKLYTMLEITVEYSTIEFFDTS